MFSRLLRRLLLGEDVEVKVPEDELPRRMRKGVVAFAERKRVNAREQLRWRLERPLSARIRSLRERAASMER